MMEEQSYFDRWLAKQLGSDRILTGDGDVQYEVLIRELPEHAKIAILEDLIQEGAGNLLEHANAMSLSDDERRVVELLRDNRMKELHQILGEELGATEYPEELKGEEAIAWSLRSTYPDLSDEEIMEQIELLKETENYDKMVNSAEKRYKEFIEDYREHKQRQEKNQLHQSMLSIRDNYAKEIARIDDDVLSFEQEDKAEIYSALFDVDEKGSNDFYDLFKTPRGMVEVAKRVVAYDKLKDIIYQLQQELEEKDNKTYNSYEVPRDVMKQYFSEI